MAPKFVKKALNAGKRYVKKRYNVGGKKRGGPNVANLTADVMKLMAMVNAEKKVYQLPLQTIFPAQCNINNTGAVCLDLTPMMAEGADQFQRNGISIKLHSQLWQMQIFQANSAVNSNTLIIEFWYNKGPTLSQTTLLSQLYDPSIFSTVIDATSTRNPDHFNDFKLMKRHKVYLPADTITGIETLKTFSIPLKFNKGKGHHIRYTGTGFTNYQTDVQSGQIFMIVRAQNGNNNALTPSTLPVAVTAADTGTVMKFSNKTWYYDN